ncbi:LysM peptidoglycan-binding domain-containing protein [Lactobacillus xujianguonis]|uniref:LysM peptidoglycan-binding domain-containing protein n=1 Tax=Lactobacillus xujianguonis TaxID=2495899 RepID=A0A437SSX1_9LACO|nr:LysM peptidoglycan-binding domain-containing protein [Lactobacillus xujianguonis]RVU70020.1 LysM peptidoglycan-binding domain-containing protein [Lactobacillus xujianguonis]
MAEQPTQPVVVTKPTEPIQVTLPTSPVAKEVKKPVANEEKTKAQKKEQSIYDHCIKHTVKPGETLLDIAQEHVVALQQLRYFNHLDKQDPKIKVGQVLYIPFKPSYVPYGE